MQKLAAGAVQHTRVCGGRTPTSSLLFKLSKIAASGKHPSNAERDLHRILLDTAIKAAMEYEDVRFLDPATGAVKPTKFPFIYPDTLACSIWHLGEEYFRYFFLGNQDAGAFWQHVAGTSWAKPALEALPAGIDRGKLIPVSFYGDDVHTYKATECGVISILAWTTDYLTAMHPSFHRYFLIAGFSEYLQCVHTWPDIMERLVERFTRLVSDANWPWCAKGYKFHMSSCTGDLKWIKERFQVFDYNANDFCAYCSARKIDPDCPSNTLSDFRETAAHRRHRFGHDDFLATTPAAESILPVHNKFSGYIYCNVNAS